MLAVSEDTEIQVVLPSTVGCHMFIYEEDSSRMSEDDGMNTLNEHPSGAGIGSASIVSADSVVKEEEHYVWDGSGD